MSLSFLPEAVKNALNHLNGNLISEIRLRKDKAVVVQYKGQYCYLGSFGTCKTASEAIFAGEISTVLNSATGGCVYNYSEQMKSGFITVEHGVRIGIAGEYVIENGVVKTINNVTSLNIRIPHDIKGCAEALCKSLFSESVKSTLIFSKPGLGKTTMLRDVARQLGSKQYKSITVLDERNEISAMDGFGEGYDLGQADVVRCHNKLGAIQSAIRAMRPDVLITDELYGGDDIKAVQYATDCGIAVIASSHVTDKKILKAMPFEYYVELTSIGGEPCIYDKDFNIIGDSGADYGARSAACGG